MVTMELEVVDAAKYLGVTITNSLSWNTHITQVISKANKVLGRISSPKIKQQAYKSIVRPLVEYSAAVWDPYTQAKVNKVEMVQRRTVRWVLNRYHNISSITGMLNQLGWPTLQLR